MMEEDLNLVAKELEKQELQVFREDSHESSGNCLELVS
jgi:hypothetical protein